MGVYEIKPMLSKGKEGLQEMRSKTKGRFSREREMAESGYQVFRR